MTQSLVSDALLKELVKDASDILADGEVTFSEIVYLGGKLAAKVNVFKSLSGKEKGDLVIKVVELALEKVLDEKTKCMDDSTKRAFSKKIKLSCQFAKETLPAVLDVAVSAARGKLDLKAAKTSCFSCLKFGMLCAKAQGVELPTKEVEKVLEEIKPVASVIAAVVPVAEVQEAVAKVEEVVAVVESTIQTAQVESPVDSVAVAVEVPQEKPSAEVNPSNKEA